VPLTWSLGSHFTVRGHDRRTVRKKFSMHAPSARTRKVVGLSAAPIAVLAAGLLVWQGSMAAFSDTTTTPGNSWTAGTVALTADNEGQATFTAGKIVPNERGEKTIVVTSTADVPGEVRLYAQNFTTGKNLAEHIDVTIVRAADGAQAQSEVSTTLAAFGTQKTGYASSIAEWDVEGTGAASPETVTYTISWVFDTTDLSQAEVNALQGGSAQVDFVWELQNAEPATPAV
jgi:predicted ribosomally synthesized peptide with SipW-like signal peptide